MPFGLINAPAIFQHLMNDIFCKFLDDFVVCYLNDILIFSKNLEGHERHVCLVLQKLWDASLYAKLEKYVLHQPQSRVSQVYHLYEGLILDPKNIQWSQIGQLPKQLMMYNVSLALQTSIGYYQELFSSSNSAHSANM